MLRHQYPRLSCVRFPSRRAHRPSSPGMEFLFPSLMRSPFAHPSFAHSQREFRDPFDAHSRFVIRHPPHHAIPRDDSDDDEDVETTLPPSPPVRHASGPVRIPINFVGHSTPPVPPQPQVRSVMRTPAATRQPPPTARARSPPSPSAVSPQARAVEDVPPMHRESTAESEIARREKQRMQSRLELYGLKERDVKGDGNCQFRALSDQLMGTSRLFAQTEH